MRTGRIAIAAIAALFIVTIGGHSFASLQAKQDVTCTVTAKDSITRDSQHQYRVYTDECGTLSVEDSLFVGQFNSADIYGQLQTGETYDLTTMGYRIPVFSVFPNIIEVR